MPAIITSLSRVTLIAFVLIYAILDCILLIFRKNEFIQEIFTVVLNILMYVFLANASLVVYVNTADDRILFLFIGQVVLFIVFSNVFKYILSNYSSFLCSNMYILLSFGFVMLERLDMGKAIRQFIFAIVSLLISIGIAYVLPRVKMFKQKYLVYGIGGIVMLLVVFLFGRTDYGAKLSIAIGNISIQPSEFVKLSYVFFISSCVRSQNKFRGFIISTVGTLIHILILALCKDLGAAFIFVVSYTFMIFVAYRSYVFLLLEGIVACCGAAMVYRLFPHIQTRFLAWSDPLSVVDNQGYQICQSLFAIGTGGWLGSGLMQGMPHKIPVVSKDFIFSAISEEMGGIVGLSLIIIYLCIVGYMIFSAVDFDDKFYVLINIGMGTIFACQSILNLGGVTKFIPSTGVTLPLISYGGSSLLSIVIMFVLVMVGKDKDNENEHSYFDYDALSEAINESRHEAKRR